VITLSTTSLTVPPSAARTLFTSARRTVAQLQRRCGPIGPVSEEALTGRRLGPAASAPRATSATVRAVSRGARSACLTVSSWPAGLARRTSVRTSTSIPDGSGGASHVPEDLPASSLASVSSENITDIRSVAATPSTMQWWTFESSAQRPPVMPSTIHSSHSGLLRSSCWENTRAAIWRSCASSPGAGIAVRRRW
jgi:hypothetical protein